MWATSRACLQCLIWKMINLGVWKIVQNRLVLGYKYLILTVCYAKNNKIIKDFSPQKVAVIVQRVGCKIMIWLSLSFILSSEDDEDENTNNVRCKWNCCLRDLMDNTAADLKQIIRYIYDDTDDCKTATIL